VNGLDRRSTLDDDRDHRASQRALIYDARVTTIQALLPLPITEVTWTDPTLTLFGKGWSLSVTCPWRVVTATGIAFGWSTPDVEDRVWDLIGTNIEAIVPQGRGAYLDPAFRLSDSTTLEVFSDTHSDPWAIHTPHLTLVGPLSEGDWARVVGGSN
jgi:hypothetical protein